jgi:hypothetical protein
MEDSPTNVDEGGSSVDRERKRTSVGEKGAGFWKADGPVGEDVTDVEESNLEARKDSIDEVDEFFEGKPKWRHDRDANNCHNCGGKFTAFLRRHHCRGCGEVFCNTCSKWKVNMTHLKHRKPVRSCKSCASPQLLRVSSVPTFGGKIVLHAYNVGEDSDKLSVFAENMECTGVRIVHEGPPTKIRCSVPQGVGINKTVTVRRADGLQGSMRFSYDKPIIQHCTRAPTAGGRIIVNGLNFGPSAEGIKVVIRHKDDQTIMKVVDQATVRLLVDHSSFECEVPPGSGPNTPITVFVGGQECVEMGMFTYETPMISDTSDVESAGGDLVITGHNFGNTSSEIKVTIMFEDWVGMAAMSTRSPSISGEFLDMEGLDRQTPPSSRRSMRSSNRGTGHDGHAVTATKVTLLSDHRKLRCRVPAYPSRTGRASPVTALRRAQVIVEVNGQRSTPGILTYLAPPPPTPPPVAAPQRSTPTKRLAFANSPEFAREEGFNGEGIVSRRSSYSIAEKRRGSSGSIDQKAVEFSGRSDSSVSQNDGGTDEVSDQLRVTELLRYKTEKPPASRKVQNDGQQAANAALLGFFGDTRLEEARLAPLPSNWIPDEEAPVCMLCHNKFSFFNRRHHCRKCGGVICGECSGQRTVIGQYSLPVRLCDECFDLAKMRKNMKTYVYEIRRLMALLPVEEGAMFRQEVVLALDEGARYRAEQTIMMDAARANARRASLSWQERAVSANASARPKMWFATPPRREMSYPSGRLSHHSPPKGDDRDDQAAEGSVGNRSQTDSMDSMVGGIVLDVSLASPVHRDNRKF